MHPNALAFAQQHRRVQRHARNSDAYSFFNLLTGPELFEQVESLLPKHRERLFAPTETLLIFLAQALSADRSCQKAVDEAAVRRVAAGLSACSTHTGAFCRARARLQWRCFTGGQQGRRAKARGRWLLEVRRLHPAVTLNDRGASSSPPNQGLEGSSREYRSRVPSSAQALDLREHNERRTDIYAIPKGRIRFRERKRS